MTLVLQPQNYFTIVRQIPNHLDLSTNYVQAVIRNAYTDAIIATVRLTDKGSQRFKYDWAVPADPSGQGFYVSIVTSVYTDSGYTTKNQNYGDDESTYLIQDRITVGRVGGANGGLDGYDVRRIVKEELQAFRESEQVDESEPEEPPEPDEPMRWDEILGAISTLQSYIEKCEEGDDDAPILAKLDGVLQAIQEKEVTPVTDLAPLLAKMDDDEKEDDTEHSEVMDAISNISTDLSEKAVKLMVETLDKKQFSTSLVTHLVTDEPKAPPIEQKKPVDINKLSS